MSLPYGFINDAITMIKILHPNASIMIYDVGMNMIQTIPYVTRNKQLLMMYVTDNQPALNTKSYQYQGIIVVYFVASGKIIKFF